MVARVRAAPSGLEPRHVASLLVDPDQQIRPLRPQSCRERAQLLAVANVAREQDDSAEPLLEPVPQLVEQRQTGETREEAGSGEPLEIAAHPRTAPAVSPKATRRWTSMKNTTTGSAVSVAPAIRPPKSVPRCVLKPASHTASVCFSGSRRRTYAMMNSFQT